MCIPYDADMIERTPILTASGYDQVVGLSNPGVLLRLAPTLYN